MRFFKLLFLSLLLSACSSIVNVDYDKEADFSQIKTFSIETKPVRVSTDTRVNSPFMLQRVVRELDSALAAKNYRKMSADADVEIKYFLDIKQEIEIQDSGVTLGVGTSSGNTGFAFAFSHPSGDSGSFDKLVLTIDMFSSKTNKLIWRGSLAYRLEMAVLLILIHI